MVLKNEVIQTLRNFDVAVGGLGLQLSALQTQIELILSKSEDLEIDAKPLIDAIKDTRDRIASFDAVLNVVEETNI